LLKIKLKSIIKLKEFQNSFFTLSEASINLLFVFISLPVFLKILGAEKYGIYLLIQSFSALIGIFNLGGNFTITKFISKYRSQNENKKIEEFSSTVFVFQLSFTLLFLVIILPFLSYVVNGWVGKNENYELIINILQFAIPLFLIDIFELNFNGMHKGFEKFDRAMKISLILKTIKYTTLLLAIIITNNLVEVYKFTLFTSIVFFIFHCFLCKKWYPNISFFNSVKFSRLKEFVNFGMWVWLTNIVSLLTTQADKWLVAFFYDLKTLAYYGLAVNIFTQIHMLLSSSVSWLFPKISFSGVTNVTRKIVNKSGIIFLFASSLIVFFLLLFGDFIFELWLGHVDYYKSRKYIKLFISLLPLYAMTIVPYYFMLGLGQIKKVFFFALLTVILITVLIIVIAKFYAAEAVIGAFLLTYSLVVFLYQNQVNILTKEKNIWKTFTPIFIAILISITLFFTYKFN
jgi:O-antigen/teichoic acid export membrane protein